MERRKERNWTVKKTPKDREKEGKQNTAPGGKREKVTDISETERKRETAS